MDTSNCFSSPEDVHAFIRVLITNLRENGLDASALEEVQSTAYTTSSEWLGELGLAVRKVQEQVIKDHSISDRLLRLMRLVHSVWPEL